jgi:hypothetical protein
MTENHPITPPSELVQQWTREYDRMDPRPNIEPFIATRAAQWGADQELEACCDWVSWWRCMVGGNRPEVGLRAFRRPKPPSLKEQTLESVKRFEKSGEFFSDQMRELEFIRKALETIDD